MIVVITWSMFFALSMTGFSKSEDKKDENKKEQTDSKKKKEEGKNLKNLSEQSKKERKKGDKVYTNIDLKNSKGNISTSTISGKLKSDGKAESSEIDEEQKKSAEEIKISELEIEYFNKLVSQIFTIQDSRRLHKIAKKDLNKVLNQFPAAVNNTNKLKRLTREKSMLLQDLDSYERSIKNARKELEKLKVEISENGLSHNLVKKAEARVKKMVYQIKSKGEDAVPTADTFGGEGY